MADSIFRKQSLDRVNSPEQLNEYIKTSRLSVWLIILSVLILILSVFVWAVFGSLDTTITIGGVTKGDTVICFTESIKGIEAGDKVKINGTEGTVTSVSQKPVSAEKATAMADTDEYTLYCLDLAAFNYVVEISVEDTLPEGYVSADVVAEEISPVSFILG